LRTKSDTGLKMHIFSRPDHQYACAQTDSRMMQVSALGPRSRVYAMSNFLFVACPSVNGRQLIHPLDDADRGVIQLVELHRVDELLASKLDSSARTMRMFTAQHDRPFRLLLCWERVALAHKANSCIMGEQAGVSHPAMHRGSGCQERKQRIPMVYGKQPEAVRSHGDAQSVCVSAVSQTGACCHGARVMRGC
jgi:hypothetical protein